MVDLRTRTVHLVTPEAAVASLDLPVSSTTHAQGAATPLECSRPPAPHRGSKHGHARCATRARQLPTGYLTDLAAAVEEAERLHWTLAQVIAVADEAVQAQADVAPESRAARTLAYQAVCRPAIRRR